MFRTGISVRQRNMRVDQGVLLGQVELTSLGSADECRPLVAGEIRCGKVRPATVAHLNRGAILGQPGLKAIARLAGEFTFLPCIREH